ncbi:hypothetical protein RIF29_19579 [Crotalaria pallida]|uniref:Peptidase C1A papain C-terminal domain-containing protein n=1 Tax=Crotalaria pallida TaxID=3830 RepID=A0AAN9I496_CROPI
MLFNHISQKLIKPLVKALHLNHHTLQIHPTNPRYKITNVNPRYRHELHHHALKLPRFESFVCKYAVAKYHLAHHIWSYQSLYRWKWCDPEQSGACDSGCNGGLMNNTFEYILQSGGVQEEKDYPYTGINGKCHFDKSKIVASVKNFSVVSLDEDQIAANLVHNGPLSVAINAVFMQTYIGGVSCPYICGKHQDHGVLLVGYGAGEYAPIRFKNKRFWILKISWGRTGKRMDTTRSAEFEIYVELIPWSQLWLRLANLAIK